MPRTNMVFPLLIEMLNAKFPKLHTGDLNILT